ncbi:aldo/keto reductase [Pseudochelatococcus sp. B33]
MTSITENRGFPSLGIGAGSLANAGGEAAFIETVQAAWARGIRYFDTSAFYLGGESERRLGLALAGLPRDQLMISTKLGRYQNHTGSSIDPENRNSYYDYSADATLRSVERSLARLGVDHLDAVYIHDLDHRLCGESYRERLDAALDGAYPVLMQLRSEKVIGAVGVAAMDWKACLEFSEAAELDVVMPAGEYSLLRTASEPLLSHCADRNIAWIAASPFNSGILATGAREDAFYDMRPATEAVLGQVARLEDVCRAHDVPLAAAALQYPARHPVISTIVFGAKSVAEFEDSLALSAFHLSDEFWADISRLIAETADWEAKGWPDGPVQSKQMTP